MKISLGRHTVVLIYGRRMGMIVGNRGWSVALCGDWDGRWNRRWLLMPLFGCWSGRVRRAGERFFIRRLWAPYISFATYRVLDGGAS